ncbi:hypothetical protein BABINDRAFT_9346 [Babjeviella inositovora NRRL Y-12698]|uniref:SPX domain-containing protein n=1 Tax=Babjeviella inositovora NRRL Y-12698 TaxID=984486 RepID=A0A1E3QNB3_9ASCO|nr:uncharacterized protein BABINDRAFT_9346 [Babjeviella inositovora NRRL Y-12698]ODQ78582.1 hypothetical protein BABINDRAFT_9346 [Babjeviella inositovora NRRL Y-12698]
MKFGKYLASRQLELPEYARHFINYKALKKHIKALARSHTYVHDEEDSESVAHASLHALVARDLSPVASPDPSPEDRLKANKASFFFKVERELEKVNMFYLEKQSDLNIRLDILLTKKGKILQLLRLPRRSSAVTVTAAAASATHLASTKNTLSINILYKNFQKLHQDVLRLEQFVELNEIGFTKALKKWDKQSKSHTKELFISTAVNVQPVFHRYEINELSDTVSGCLLELEAIMDGDLPKGGPALAVVLGRAARLAASSGLAASLTGSPPPGSPSSDGSDTDDKEMDDMYNEFVNLSLLPPSPETESVLTEWIRATIARTYAREKISRVFLHAVGNATISDEFLQRALAILEDSPLSYLDLSLTDELTGETCLHAACKLAQARRFVIPLALAAGVPIGMQDGNGRTCLHYASVNGRDEVLRELLEATGEVDDCSDGQTAYRVDILDNESMSPLLLAIQNNALACVQVLLAHGANPFPRLDDSTLQYLPLNYACRFGDAAVVHALIACAPAVPHQADVEGLYPLHVAARYGHAHLILLLVQGVDESGSLPLKDDLSEVNRLDGLNKWPPLFYAITNSHSDTAEQLILHGAHCGEDMLDDDGFLALYYAAMAGGARELNLLLKYGGMRRQSVPTRKDSRSQSPMDLIPDFQLPPPIIPLRRYGHNFLDKKIFLQLQFYPNRESIVLYNSVPGGAKLASSFASADTVHANSRHTLHASAPVSAAGAYKQPPGRITLSTNILDVVPRNILLPITDSTNTVSFQIEARDLAQFAVDFELFPTFGTRLIAKATSMVNLFTRAGKLHGYNVTVPLFDVRLRNAGELKFDYRIVHPYSGVPLEISKYETYWKSTKKDEIFTRDSAGKVREGSARDTDGPARDADGPVRDANGTARDLASPSMLSFVTASSLSGQYLRIRLVMLNDGTPVVCPHWLIPVGSIDVPIANLTPAELDRITSDLFDYPKLMLDLHGRNFNTKLLQKVLKIIYLPFKAFLQIVPPEVNLDIEVYYPTDIELQQLPYLLNSVRNSNKFIDAILTNIFTHIRALKEAGTVASRSIVFSSSNPDICTILNWKQPNYPVFFSMGGLRFEREFCNTTTHGFALCGAKEDVATYSLSAALKFATNNNLLGIIVAGRLLEAVPDLVATIRSRGLILVATQDADHTAAPAPLANINGQRFNDVLSFNEDVSV